MFGNNRNDYYILGYIRLYNIGWGWNIARIFLGWFSSGFGLGFGGGMVSIGIRIVLGFGGIKRR